MDNKKEKMFKKMSKEDKIYFLIMMLLWGVDLIIMIINKEPPLILTFCFGILVPYMITREHKNTILKIVYLVTMLLLHYCFIIISIIELNRKCSGFDCINNDLAFFYPIILTFISLIICTTVYYIIRLIVEKIEKVKK